MLVNISQNLDYMACCRAVIVGIAIKIIVALSCLPKVNTIEFCGGRVWRRNFLVGCSKPPSRLTLCFEVLTLEGIVRLERQ